MRQDGFTLLEMIVVVAIVGILLAIGTLQFNSHRQKAEIESQVRTMYADLTNVRATALYKKRERSVKITTTGYSIYSSTVVSVPPVQQTSFKWPVNPASLQIDFDEHGIGTFNGDDTEAAAAVCVQVASNAIVDSIAFSRSQAQVGKLQAGMGCASDKIDLK